MYLFKRTALFVGVVFMLSTCSGSTQTQDTSVSTGLTPQTTSTKNSVFQLSELKSAEDRWSTSNISNYQFTISYGCFMACGSGPVRVTVKNNQVTSVFPIDVQGSASNRRIPQFAYVALDLFKLIRGHIGDFEFSVTYDKQTGFPLSFYSDYKESWLDDEFGFQTKDFELTS